MTYFIHSLTVAHCINFGFFRLVVDVLSSLRLVVMHECMNAVYSSEVMYEMGQIQDEVNAIAPGLNKLGAARDKDKQG